MIPVPRGFGIPLVDFAFFVIFALLIDKSLRPEPVYRWLWIIICAFIALFFFLAWLVDLGAHL